MSLYSSLRGRLTIAFVGVVLVTMVILAAVIPFLAREYEIAAFTNRLTDEAQLLADVTNTELERDGGASLDGMAKRLGRETETRFTIIRLDGAVVGDSDQDLAKIENHAGRPEVRQALAEGHGTDIHYSVTVGYDMLYVAVPIVHDGQVFGTARTSLALSEVNRLVTGLTQAILLAAIGSGLFAVAVAVVAAKAITSPLDELTRYAAALGADPARSTAVRRVRGPTEVVQLGETLSQLSARVGDALARVVSERDRLDTVLANLADAVVIVNSDGRVTRLNPAAERLLDGPATDGTGRTVPEVLRDHELIALVERVRDGSASGGESVFLEWRNPRRFLRASARRFGAGPSSQILLVLHDLTELRRLESIRRDFVANVSHELRTPIAAIKAMSETLSDGAIDDPMAARDFLTRIDQEIDGLHQLVEELLELSRLESGRVEVALAPIEPSALIERAVHRLSPMAERAGVDLRVVLPPELPLVDADAERMGQVFVNLIHNAIKFTPPGGAITVRAAVEERSVRFEIEDTGVGVAPDVLPRLFERFYKVDQARSGGGTGLGLAIAKHTVQLHAGEIWAESEGPGRGTTVFVRLPRVGENRADTQPANASA